MQNMLFSVLTAADFQTRRKRSLTSACTRTVLRAVSK